MSLINSTAIPSGATFEIEQSLRSKDTAKNGTGSYLSWTPPNNNGNKDAWTYSVWAKGLPAPNAKSCQTQMLLTASGGTSHQCYIILSNDGNFDFRQYHNSEGYHFRKISTALFRDPSAWYHYVVTYDADNSTAEDRIKMYVNGERITSFGTNTNPSSGRDSFINGSGIHAIGRNAYSGVAQTEGSIDGYIAEAHFIDGIGGLTPSSFGETGNYGEWKPKKYSGNYGALGWYLPFKQDYTVEGFSSTTYKGNATTNYIGGVGFQPDFVWMKNREIAASHGLYDSIRGTGTAKSLKSDSTAAEGDASTNMNLVSFDSDGFTLGATSGTNQINYEADSHIAWCWDMGGSNATNTTGSIQSTVRANPSYGQSIVSWTGNATGGASVGTGLSAAAELIILKNRETTGWWRVHDNIAGKTNGRMGLQASDGQSTDYAITFQSNKFTFDNDSGPFEDWNGNNDGIIAYCFHSVDGYSKVGSYTANGNEDGAFVYLGFRPAFLLRKKSSASGYWIIQDNERPGYNTSRNNSLPTNQNVLYANTSGGESFNNEVSFLSNGFKANATDAFGNTDGATIIYLAFAETPFKYSNAR